MKKLNAIALLFFVASMGIFAQEMNEPRYIEINGEAEIEVTPDEIYMIGVIREEKPETFEKNEKAFLVGLKKLGVSDDDINLADMSGEFASAWFKKDQLVKEKTYQVKLSSAEMLGKFLKLADETGVKNVQILRTDLSNRKEVEKELRINAVKDAKDKAMYMTEAIGSSIGKPLQIRENYLSVYRGQQRVNDLMMVQESFQAKSKMEEEPVIGFKKIRMEIKVMVRFEITGE